MSERCGQTAYPERMPIKSFRPPRISTDSAINLTPSESWRAFGLATCRRTRVGPSAHARPGGTKCSLRSRPSSLLSQALEDMRNDRRLKQTEIVGLSERHVRRLEKEEVRLTVEAATRFAGAFGLTLSGFLDELSERITALRGDCDDSAARRSGRSQSIAAHPVTPPAHHLAPGAGVRSTRAADRCSLRGSAKR